MAKYMLTDEIAGDGCVLCLPMNEGAGSYVYDRSGYGNHGTIYGATWQGSRPRNALKFDGEQTYVDCGNDASLHPNQLTWMLWFNRKAKTDETYDELFRNGFYRNRIVFENNSDYLMWELGDTDSNPYWQTIEYMPPTEYNKWHFVAVMYDGTYMKAYLDGELKATKNIGAITIYYGTNPLTIGYGTATRAFNGLIGPVRIYARALTPDEIRDHFLGRYTDNTGLRLYLPMNEGAGATVWDHSSYGNHGTLHNFPDTSAGYGDTHSSGWTRYGRYENGYLSFDGVDDYVEVPETQLGDTVTVMAWIKWDPTQTETWGIISDRNFDFQLFVRNDRVIRIVATDADGDEEGYCIWKAPADELNNVWAHVVGVAYPGGAKLYFNGKLVKEVTNSAFDGLRRTVNTVGIGAFYKGTQRHLKGTIDEVRIYNRALSEEEIQAHFRGARVFAQRNLAVIR